MSRQRRLTFNDTMRRKHEWNNKNNNNNNNNNMRVFPLQPHLLPLLLLPLLPLLRLRKMMMVTRHCKKQQGKPLVEPSEKSGRRTFEFTSFY